MHPCSVPLKKIQLEAQTVPSLSVIHKRGISTSKPLPFEGMCSKSGPPSHSISQTYQFLTQPYDSFIPTLLLKWEQSTPP